MRMRVRYSGVALLIALGIAVGVAAASQPPVGAIALTGTITEHHKVFGFPVGQGAVPLARETWVFKLTSVRARGKRFGYAILACSFISVHSTIRQCAGTFSLPKGKIIVAGSFFYPTLYQLAVTGGTDQYAAAGGNLSARTYPDGRVAFAFALR